MTGKIFRSTLAASLTVLLASLLVITGCLYTYFGTVREQQLQTELTLAAAAVEADGADYLARVRDTAERLTWVASDGTVLYDTRRRWGTTPSGRRSGRRSPAAAAAAPAIPRR